MRIDELFMRNFAGFDREQVCFSPGLNLICGPNEAGKSTLMAALEVALFAPLSYHKRSDDYDWIDRFFPRDGGDNFQLRLVGEGSQTPICISKHYFRDKNHNRGEIEFGGRHYADGVRMQKMLREILGFGRGTYRSTVLINQGSLDGTIEQLQRRADDSIEQTLRSAVFESEGVSVQHFDRVLSERLQAKIKRWDLDSNQPQRPQRYERDLGTIIEAHYEWEDLGKEVQQVRAQQQRVENLRDEIKRKEELQEENEAKADRLSDLAEKWQQHEEYQRVHKSHQEARRAVYNWKSHRERVEHYDEKLNEFDEKLRRQQQALEQVQKARQYRQLCQLREQLEEFRTEIDECDEALDELAEVTESEVQRLQKMDLEVERTRGKLQGLQLFGEIQLACGVECILTGGPGEQEAETLSSSGEFTAIGRFTLEVPDTLRLQVRSADEELDQLQQQLRSRRDELADRLDSLGCDSVESAREIYQDRKSHADRKRELTNSLDSRLQARDLSDFSQLQQKISQLEGDTNPYLQCCDLPADEQLQQGAEEIRSEREEFIRQSEPIKGEFKKWQETFDSFDGATARQAQLKSRIQKLEDELSEDFDPESLDWDSPQDMRRESRRLLADVQNLTEEIQQLRSELRKSEEYLEENPLEQLQKKRQQMQQKREREKKAARALREVRRCFERVRQQLDAQTFTGLKNKFAEHLALVTDGRYEIGDMEGLQPEGLRRPGEGVQFPLRLLSAGTQDCAALSLRLAIAAEIFESGDRFILMDEPVVNFDTQRKKRAANLIRAFAQDFQVLLFSCDAETRALLEQDAKTIEYDRRL